MKRYPGLNMMLLATAVLAAACGGKEPSVAEKSAAAYREAEAKGVPVGGGHDHGDHGATTTGGMDHSAHGATSTSTAAMDHSAHGAGAGAHAGMNHGATASGATDHSGHTAGAGSSVDHAAMGHATSATNAHAGHTAASSTNAHAGHGATASRRDAHAGHSTTPATHDAHAGHSTSPATRDAHAGHSTAPATRDAHAAHGATPAAATHDQHAGMQHGTAAVAANAHAQHGTAATTSAPTIAPAPRSNTEIQRARPAATLRRDAFDAPAAVSVAEAEKAAQGGSHEGHGTRGITPGQDRENPPTPMPATRDGSTSTRPAATDHSQHGAQPAAATIYSCPMHPEVTSDRPANCPKCGMALVKKK